MSVDRGLAILPLFFKVSYEGCSSHHIDLPSVRVGHAMRMKIWNLCSTSYRIIILLEYLWWLKVIALLLGM
jgi:hypothetical protein